MERVQPSLGMRMQPTTFGRKIAASVILCCAPRRALICKALDGV